MPSEARALRAGDVVVCPHDGGRPRRVTEVQVWETGTIYVRIASLGSAWLPALELHLPPRGHTWDDRAMRWVEKDAPPPGGAAARAGAPLAGWEG